VPSVSGFWLTRFVLIGVLAWLISRAFFLQVVLGDNNRLLALGNSLTIKPIEPERGVIVDRNGEVLARNTVEGDKRIREYPYKEAVAHLVGYVSKVTKEDMDNCDKTGCNLLISQVIGRMGVEKSFEAAVMGKPGEELMQVDAAGRKLRSLKTIDATNGETLKLTIDAKLSAKIMDFLSSRAIEKRTVGSVIVNKIENGEILAMVNWPSFDPNLFMGASGSGKYKSAKDVVDDSVNKPMFNRSISGLYPPGSVYKVVPALAGLESGKINADTQIEDTGEIKVGEYTYGTWYFDQYGRREGMVNLSNALKRSNDIYFYKLGEMVGVDGLKDWSIKLGLGEKTGISLGGEASGRVPDPIWKERTKGERWFLGNTYHMSIGQGDLLVTPLQVAEMISSAVSGRLCRPMLSFSEKTECKDLDVAVKNREAVIEGMLEACKAGGTAFTLFDVDKPIICKTGTAQHLEGHDPHSWITVVIPRLREGREVEREDYEKGIVLTVLLDEAGEGSREAGGIARMIVDYLLMRADL
jgi:penicillin-binding protein 2